MSLDPNEELSESYKTEILRWFRNRYDRPENCLPLDDEDDTGYAWIYGPPHDAREVIESEFSDTVSQEVLESVIREIEDEHTLWVSRLRMLEADREAREEYIDSIVSSSEHVASLKQTLREIGDLVQRHDDPYVRKLALVGAISALEAFFLDFFTSRVMNDELLFRKLVESHRPLNGRTLKLSEIFKRKELLKDEVATYLTESSWHRIEHVVSIYSCTFDIDFPRTNFATISPDIANRHSILHRGGKTKSGEFVAVSKEALFKLIGSIQSLASDVERAVDAACQKD